MITMRHIESYKRSILGLIFAVVFLPGAFAVKEASIFEGAPAAPPGYEDFQKAHAAVLSGKVPAINQAPTVPSDIEFRRGIVYASPGGVDLQLDLFLPAKTETSQPILLFVHGGGWRKGKKEDYLYYNIEFAKLGYVTASMQYRLSPEHHFPAAVQDVKCAIAWLKKNSAEINGDPGRVALIGGSAGGHLSMMGGYAQDPALDCPDLPEGLDTRVRAVVNLYGVADCTAPVAQTAQSVIDFIGKPYADAPEAYTQASPMHHLDKADPPTLTFHGTVDELVPVAQSDDLHKKLDGLGIPNYYDRIEGWPHTMDLAQPINDRCRYIMQRFFEKHLNL